MLDAGPSGRRLRSLDTVHSGETVQVIQVLFPSLRDLCRDIGFGEGDVIRCSGDGKSHLFLETRASRKAMLERDWSRFVSVVDAPGW